MSDTEKLNELREAVGNLLAAIKPITGAAPDQIYVNRCLDELTSTYKMCGFVDYVIRKHEKTENAS